MDNVKHQINLLTNDGYFGFFYGLRNSYNNDQDCFMEIENIAEAMYGVKIFDNYETFKWAKHIYMNSIKKTDYSLLSTNGYMIRHQILRETTETDEEAFNMLEAEILDKFECNIYTKYQSFIKARSRYLAHRRDKTLKFKFRTIRKRFNKKLSK